MNDMQRYLVNEFVADYKEGLMSRRDMIKRVLYITGSVAGTATLLAAMGCSPAAAPAPPTPAQPKAAQPTAAPTTAPAPQAKTTIAGPNVSPDDPDIEAKDIEFRGPAGTLLAYSAKPKGNGPFPGVLVIHENRGLVDHIKDITRRLAKSGYAALAVDLVSRNGGTAKADPAQVPGLLSGMKPEDQVADLSAGIDYLKAQSYVRADRIGTTGFCFGGGLTWRMAGANKDVKAAVPYYGPSNPQVIEALANTNAAILGIFAEDDNFVNSNRQAIDDALKKANKTYQIRTYPGTQHAFNNDTGPRYKPEQAKEAWEHTIAWFDTYLKV